MASFGVVYDLDYELEDGTDAEWRHFCGGAIVGQNAIITASHCFKNTNGKNIQIKLGDEYLNTPTDDELMQIHDVNTIVKHPDYQRGIDFDVAVVFTNKKIEVSQKVKPICLPTKNQTNEYFWSGHTVY